MLTVTTNAAHAINAVLGEVPQGGLRISPASANGDELQLQVAVVEAPAPTDEVVEGQGTHVFIDRQVAPLLDGKTLDADVGADRGVRFAIVD